MRESLPSLAGRTPADPSLPVSFSLRARPDPPSPPDSYEGLARIIPNPTYLLTPKGTCGPKHTLPNELSPSSSVRCRRPWPTQLPACVERVLTTLVRPLRFSKCAQPPTPSHLSTPLDTAISFSTPGRPLAPPLPHAATRENSSRRYVSAVPTRTFRFPPVFFDEGNRGRREFDDDYITISSAAQGDPKGAHADTNRINALLHSDPFTKEPTGFNEPPHRRREPPS